MTHAAALCREAILSALPESYPYRESLHCFDCIDSTNTALKEMAAGGAPHGTALVADAQTQGRGRLGRSFHSPAGEGIYLSFLLRPQCPPDALMHLTCAAAVAMCDAVERCCGLRPGIKWTNDLVVGKRKLGGILTELSADRGLVQYAVVGVGINCCQTAFPPELSAMATSVQLETSSAVDRARLCAGMLEALSAMADTLHHTDLSAYRRDCVTLGQQISVLRGDQVRHGTALDIDDAGALLVRYETGQTEFVTSGEVSIRGMYGYL